MQDCIRLFRADKIEAFYSDGKKALVISAEVTFNSFTNRIQICRNPLEPLLPTPAVHEYMVVGTTRPGIHPELVVKQRISASFSMDFAPARVGVYSMGIDNAERVEIPVVNQPTPASVPAQPIARPQISAPAPVAPVEATGWSKAFMLQEALFNAVTELRAAAGFRSPDVDLAFEVVAIGGQVDGLTLHKGVFVKVKGV